MERGRERKERESENFLAEAEEDASEALSLVPGHRGALRLLGEVLAASKTGSSEAADGAFLAFRKLHLSSSSCGGDREEVGVGVEEMARACLEAEERAREGGGSSASSPPRAEFHRNREAPPSAAFNRDEEQIAAALEELGIPLSRGSARKLAAPAAAAVRAAFLSRAARCHPDKMKSDVKDSGEEFMRAHRAYLLLMSVASS